MIGPLYRLMPYRYIQSSTVKFATDYFIGFEKSRIKKSLGVVLRYFHVLILSATFGFMLCNFKSISESFDNKLQLQIRSRIHLVDYDPSTFENWLIHNKSQTNIFFNCFVDLRNA